MGMRRLLTSLTSMENVGKPEVWVGGTGKLHDAVISDASTIVRSKCVQSRVESTIRSARIVKGRLNNRVVLLLELEYNLISHIRVQERRRIDRVSLRVAHNDGMCRRRRSGRAVGRLERGADGQSLLLERVELVPGVGGEHHSGTAVAVGESGVLRTVNPDWVFLKSGEVSGFGLGSDKWRTATTYVFHGHGVRGEVVVLTGGNGEAVV